MERPDFSGEYHRPELDRNNPGGMFAFAKDEQRRLRKIVAQEQLPNAITFLVEKLERFITLNFEQLPEITVRAKDIQRKGGISKRDADTYIIRSELIPLDEIDAEVFGAHTITGVLYGFYRGDDEELRVYISAAEAPVMMPSGIYTPLLSVGIEEAEIRLKVDESEEQLEVILGQLDQSLDEYDITTKELVKVLITELNNADYTATRKLQGSSSFLAEIARRAADSPHVLELLLQMVCIKLDLLSPQNISVSQHYVPYPDYPTLAFVPRGPAAFPNVKPELELVGETDSKELGLFFLDDEEQAVKVPVRYITSIRKI